MTETGTKTYGYSIRLGGREAPLDEIETVHAGLNVLFS
jgi:hypothetical protein